jgi:hypothetical protein
MYNEAKMKKRSKMGRPAFRPADRLSKQTVIRFRPAELVRLRREARAAGLGLTTYLRKIILKKED